MREGAQMADKLELPLGRYLTRREAAELCRVPVPTFDKLRRDGAIPRPDAEVGKHKLWREATIEQFLAGGGTRR